MTIPGPPETENDADEQGLPPLPDHQDELMSSHEGRPTVSVQAMTHGAGIPAVDRGIPDDVKYQGAM